MIRGRRPRAPTLNSKRKQRKVFLRTPCPSTTSEVEPSFGRVHQGLDLRCTLQYRVGCLHVRGAGGCAPSSWKGVRTPSSSARRPNGSPATGSIPSPAVIDLRDLPPVQGGAPGAPHKACR
eukprot:6966491-Pyramimonas_sp.AAC.1